MNINEFDGDLMAVISCANKKESKTTRRIELGEVINEMKAFAIIKDIPVITCSHLNRDACAKIDAAFKGNIESKSSMDSSSMPVYQDQLKNLYNIYNLAKDDDGMRKAFERMVITAYPDKAETMLQLFRMNSKLLGKEVD